MTLAENRAKKAAYMRAYTKRTGCAKAAYDDPVKLEKQRARWRAAHARWRANNPQKHRAMSKRYAEENSLKMRTARREYAARRLETDANFRLLKNLRCRLTSALRSCKATKSRRTVALLGCDIPFLCGYLEARFQPDMTWANFGKWHIDHHIPCAEFDLRDPAQQRQCFHYSNLRPMWAAENMSKGAKRPESHQSELL